VQPAIPKFYGHYDHWAKLMENFLRSKQYWNLVEQGIAKVVDGAAFSAEDAKFLEEQKLKDLKIKIIFIRLLIVRFWILFLMTRPLRIFGIQ